MAKTEEIPQQNWVEYLDEFTRVHQGEQVTVEVMDSEVGAQLEAQDMPFQGISADLKRSGEHDVNIILGKEPDMPLSARWCASACRRRRRERFRRQIV